MNVKPFKQAFCDYYKCPPEQYLRKAFLRSLHARARPIGWLLTEQPECLEVLEEAGKTTSEEELRDVIEQFEYEVNVRRGKLTGRWKFRVSGQRLLELNARIRK